ASDQTPEAFFANPIAPDPALYDAFRAAMLATSQIPGSFYTAPGRCRVLRQITDRMLAPNDAYDRVLGPCAPINADPVPQIGGRATRTLGNVANIR
ncbi:MAG: hypothetical protein ACPGVS_03085, partial [Primorskyibacter sp.]